MAGRVIAIAVHDNQRVQRGQVLFRLDDRPFRIAVEEAKAKLARRAAGQAMQATYRQKLADDEGGGGTLAYQQREYRAPAAARRDAASAPQATFDQVQNAMQVARQKVVSTQKRLANMLAQLGGDPNLPIDQHPTVQQAQAALDKAELDLERTVVRAPANGIVTKVEQLQVGSYVTAAAPVFPLVSTRVWIEANFKETELTHMRPGQTGDGRDRHLSRRPCWQAAGRKPQPGTGADFSLLPAENATGNWVKVVQRLPVRVAIDRPDRRCRCAPA